MKIKHINIINLINISSITKITITILSLYLSTSETVQAHLIDINGTHKNNNIDTYHPAIGLELPIALLILSIVIYQIIAKKRLKKHHFAALILILLGSLFFV